MIRVLVIEDEEYLRDEIMEWLGFEGYEAIGAGNGPDGVKEALAKQPELIISDIMLPGYDGYRVLLELRTHPETALTPFIFMSALAERAQVRKGMELGAEDYIVKPFTTAELMKAIRTRLERHSNFRQQFESAMDQLRHRIIHALPNELRTPLVGVLGYAEIIAMDADTLTPDQIKEIGQEILKSGQNLHRLTENYMLYAQLELVRENRLQSEQIDNAPQLISAVCNTLGSKYERTEDIRCQLVECPIRIPEKDFEKIVYELVDNALKFSKKSTPVLISTEVKGEFLNLEVSDRGRGIAQENLKEIGAYMQFERKIYEQQGSGLGLVLAKKLVELNGGTFSLESEIGKGTTVRVGIPSAK